GNLSFDTTDADLTAAFEQGGLKVSSVQVMADRDTGRSRGFAFVEMASAEDAQAAVKAMDGAQLDGRALRVNEAEERKPKSGGGEREATGAVGHLGTLIRALACSVTTWFCATLAAQAEPQPTASAELHRDYASVAQHLVSPLVGEETQPGSALEPAAIQAKE